MLLWKKNYNILFLNLRFENRLTTIVKQNIHIWGSNGFCIKSFKIKVFTYKRGDAKLYHKLFIYITLRYGNMSTIMKNKNFALAPRTTLFYKGILGKIFFTTSVNLFLQPYVYIFTCVLFRIRPMTGQVKLGT